MAMDRSLLTTLGKIFPREKTFLLKEFFGMTGDVDDPWPDGKDDTTLARYRACAEELRQVLAQGLDRLIRALDL